MERSQPPGTVLGYEQAFLPPLDLGEAGALAWGPPWDHQVDAALAWQAAGGDGEAGTSPVRSRPTMTTVVRMNTLLVALRERMLQIQNEAANVAIAEMNLRHAPALESSLPVTQLPPLPQLSDGHAERIAALAQSWFEMVAAAQDAMTTLLGAAAAPPKVAVERRQKAVLIPFADRRKAA